MWKRPLIISSIIMLIGAVIIFYYRYSWRFASGFFGYLAGVYYVIITVILSSTLVIGAIVYTVFSWEKENVATLLPLLALIIVIFLYSYLILPGKFMTSYPKNFFEKNFQQYSEAAAIMNKVKLINDQEEYKLPFRYRYLSENGRVRIINREHKEIIFFLRCGVGAGEFLVFTPTDQTIFESNENFTVVKKKNNWYYVEEY